MTHRCLDGGIAWMVELVDTTDLKSVGPNGPCGFKSRSGYPTGDCSDAVSRFCLLSTVHKKILRSKFLGLCLMAAVTSFSQEVQAYR